MSAAEKSASAAGDEVAPVLFAGSVTATLEEEDRLLDGFTALAQRLYRETRTPSPDEHFLANARELALLCFEVARAFRAARLRGTHGKKREQVMAILRDPAFAGLSHTQLATRLGVSQGTVAVAARFLRDAEAASAEHASLQDTP